jgi:hypothetical protein
MSVLTHDKQDESDPDQESRETERHSAKSKREKGFANLLPKQGNLEKWVKTTTSHRA